ncbi:MAG: hypothetical protein Q7S04_02850 [Candidatus Moranbacteria bacterium]|nr:hypothetical protein [Candidatus Moranbacteria bacterium]
MKIQSGKEVPLAIMIASAIVSAVLGAIQYAEIAPEFFKNDLVILGQALLLLAICGGCYEYFKTAPQKRTRKTLSTHHASSH